MKYQKAKQDVYLGEAKIFTAGNIYSYHIDESPGPYALIDDNGDSHYIGGDMAAMFEDVTEPQA